MADSAVVGMFPGHIRQFQQEVSGNQQPQQPFTVFGDPSAPAQPAQQTFQQQQSQPFTAFIQNQQSLASNQQPFQIRAQEVPRSSQQFQSRPQVGAFDQIKSAINSGTRFSPQQGSFPQREQFAAATTGRPTPVTHPKFEPLAAVPPGSEQIGTHKSLEETVRSKITLKNKKGEKEKMVKTSSVSRKHNGRKKGEKKGSDKVEIVNELSKILEVLSKSSSIKSKSKEIASIMKSKKKPDTSLIRIQEKLLGLSAVKKEKDSSEESENISDLLNLLSTQSRKKTKEKSKSSISSP